MKYFISNPILFLFIVPPPAPNTNTRHSEDPKPGSSVPGAAVFQTTEEMMKVSTT